jgi:hypothetical protein
MSHCSDHHRPVWDVQHHHPSGLEGCWVGTLVSHLRPLIVAVSLWRVGMGAR